MWYGVYNEGMNTPAHTSDRSTKSLTIGQVSQAAGIGIETVRFYERQGLLAEPARTRSGYRLYGESAIARLQFIRRAKDLGFTLNEIRGLLELRRDPTATAGDVRREARLKLADVEQKIESLQQIRAALLALVNKCPGHGSLSECPIVEAMELGAGTKSRKRGAGS